MMFIMMIMMMVRILMFREADWAMGGAALGLLAALVEMVVGKVGIIITIVISIIITIVISISIISSISISIVVIVVSIRDPKTRQRC